jgi:hypothetical protein
MIKHIKFKILQLKSQNNFFLLRKIKRTIYIYISGKQENRCTTELLSREAGKQINKPPPPVWASIKVWARIRERDRESEKERQRRTSEDERQKTERKRERERERHNID